MHLEPTARLRVRPIHTVAAAFTVLAAPAFFVVELPALGLALLVAGLLLAWFADHAEGGFSARPSLLRDLSLIAIGLGIVRLIPLAAELDDRAMIRFTLALGGAVAVPYLISRFVYRDRATGFPWRGRHAVGHGTEASRSEARGGARGGGPRSQATGDGTRWGRLHWTWLAAVLVLGWAILPFYFISSGVYRNWPVVDSPDLILRLFIGVGAVGIWDELFFICTVFAVLLRHFPYWLANLLQAVVFVSFLWELGYRAWGPLLTVPFALMQGWIFLRTRSLGYVVTVHLLFDAIVFAVLVHAHNPALFDVFPTAP